MKGEALKNIALPFGQAELLRQFNAPPSPAAGGGAAAEAKVEGEVHTKAEAASEVKAAAEAKQSGYLSTMLETFKFFLQHDSHGWGRDGEGGGGGGGGGQRSIFEQVQECTKLFLYLVSSVLQCQCSCFCLTQYFSSSIQLVLH